MRVQLKNSIESINKRIAHKNIVITPDSYKGLRQHAEFTHICGHTWLASSRSVICTDIGCPPCGVKRRSQAKIRTQEDVSTQLNGWGFEALSKYTGATDPLTVKHIKCGYVWSTTVASLRVKRSGDVCPSCAKYGFNPNQPAIMYYLRVCDGLAYKQGVTNRTVADRYLGSMDKIHIVKEWRYERGADARAHEQAMLFCYRKDKYTGPPLLPNGNTELFSRDILNLDSET